MQLQYSVRGEYQRAHAICDELLRIATIQAAETADVEMIGQARTWRGYSLLYHGDFLKAKEDFDRVYNLPIAAAPKSEKLLFDWRIQSRAFASFILWVLGYPEAAQNIGAEALKTARQEITSTSGQAIETAHLGFSNLDAISALWWSAAANLLLGNWQLAQSQADSGSWLAENSGLRGLVVVFAICRGWSLARLGQTEEGVSDLVRYHREAMTSVVSQWLFVALADAYLAGGRYAEGIAAVDEGMAEVERTGLRSHEAELCRLKGELLLKEDESNHAKAQACFERAIEIARRQSAKSWELRATISLARLLVPLGRRDEARTMLAEIYDWFTEGFDTCDLQEAKQLLNELD
jgi:predicted ATPase